MSIETATTVHYGEGSFEQRATDLLAREGLDHDGLAWFDLARLDHFHTGGLEATKRLAELIAPTPGQHILDVGSGLGGPARYIAATYGCHVTGIDLTSDFVRVATIMTGYAGMANKNKFVVGNALAMPFDDGEFDGAYSQHVAMNIADRAGLYREIRRVLKPGSSFAVHDVLAGNGEPVEYPMPWATTAAESHLISETEMHHLVTAAGFSHIDAIDMTEIAKVFFTAMAAAPQDPNAPANLSAFLGPEFVANIMNLRRQTFDGRVRMGMALYRAD
jgi:sarcosine/dimethylglycine N-methyltransferase